MQNVRRELQPDLFRRSRRAAAPRVSPVKRLFDYAEYGGALLLGVNGVVVISHGRSNAIGHRKCDRVAAARAQIMPRRRSTGHAGRTARPGRRLSEASSKI